MTKLLDDQPDFHRSVEAVMAIDKACKNLTGNGECPCPCGGIIHWWKDSPRAVRARCDSCGFRVIG